MSNSSQLQRPDTASNGVPKNTSSLIQTSGAAASTPRAEASRSRRFLTVSVLCMLAVVWCLSNSKTQGNAGSDPLGLFSPSKTGDRRSRGASSDAGAGGRDADDESNGSESWGSATSGDTADTPTRRSSRAPPEEEDDEEPGPQLNEKTDVRRQGCTNR
jgi:hypothetical protein